MKIEHEVVHGVKIKAEEDLVESVNDTYARRVTKETSGLDKAIILIQCLMAQAEVQEKKNLYHKDH